MVMTGELSLSALPTTGGLTSRGRRARTVAMRSRTSCVAASMSRSSENIAMTIELPAPETDRSSSRPWTVLTTSSIGWLISTSTSSGEAPGSDVRMKTEGRSMAGKRSTPRRM